PATTRRQGRALRARATSVPRRPLRARRARRVGAEGTPRSAPSRRRVPRRGRRGMYPRRRGGRRPDRRRALTHGQAVRRDHHLKQRGSVSDPIEELSTSTVVLSPAARTEIPTAARITYKAATTTAARKTGRTPVRSLRLRTSGPELASSPPRVLLIPTSGPSARMGSWSRRRESRRLPRTRAPDYHRTARGTRNGRTCPSALRGRAAVETAASHGRSRRDCATVHCPRRSGESRTASLRRDAR